MAREQILIVDDEPYYLEWLGEFLVQLGYDPVFIESANEAVKVAADRPFRAIIFDLNIPISGALRELAAKKGGLYAKYPGLYLAFAARNAGWRSKQIIVYSVHSLEEINEECGRLYCTYIAKGRPALFKQELLDVISYDPTKEKKMPPGAPGGQKTGPSGRTATRTVAQTAPRSARKPREK